MMTWYFERADASFVVKERVLLILPPKQVGIKIVPFFEVGLMDLYATRTFSRVEPLAKRRKGMV